MVIGSQSGRIHQRDQAIGVRSKSTSGILDPGSPCERPNGLLSEGPIDKPVSPDFLLTERYADTLFLAPDNVAMLAYFAGPDVQRDLVRNGEGADDLEGSSGGGDVANGAIDSDAVELNRSGLEYAFPRLRTSLIHPITLNEKFKSRVNERAETTDHPKRFGNRRGSRAGGARMALRLDGAVDEA
jgi:hypothetical protein